MHVLVAVDESEQAGDVVRLIAPYLKAMDADVSLVTFVDEKEVHAVERGGTHSEPAQPAGDLSGGRVPSASGHVEVRITRDQAIEQVVETHRQTLRELAEAQLPGVDVQLHADIADDVPQAIVAHAEAEEASLIAIGTHGRGGIQRALLGSVAEAVIRTSPVPVLVVREGMGEKD